MKKWIKRIAVGLLIILIGLQFISIDKTNPPINEEQDMISILNPPVELATTIRKSCYDCHSHHTTYPWYTNIAPFSFWIKDHIEHGRRHLNFSIWGTYDQERAHHKLEECFEEVQEGHMPLPSYLWIHDEAKLSPEIQETLATWFKSQMSKYQ